MPKNTVAEWDTTPANNTDVGGVNIAEGCAFGNINDAIRTVMAQVRTLNPVATSAIGSTVQAYDAGLTSIAGLTTEANRMIYTTGADAYAVTPLTAAGRALLDDADAAAQRTTLGLGGLATLDILDEDDFASNSATRPPSQQSVGAYIDGRTYTSAAQSIVSAGQVTLTHGLGATPRWVNLWLVCTEAEGGFQVGDEILASLNSSDAAVTRSTTVARTSTQIIIRFSNQPLVFSSSNPTSGVYTTLTNSRWRMIVEAGL